MIQWGQPEWLHALWGVALVGVALRLLAGRRERQLTRLLDASVLDTMLSDARGRRQRRREWCWILALAFGVLALARPQWGERWIEVQHMGLDIWVVLDTSNSMRAEDVRPHRLARAQLGLRDLVGQLRGDRIGLVPFAGSSYLYCPLTTDYSAFLMMLDDVRPGIIPRGGTAIEQALRRAMNAFDDHLVGDRVILLITDGEDHEGDPLSLVDTLRRRNIRVFAVGVGTPEGDLIPMTDERGRMNFLRDREGHIVRTRLQEDVLERLAARTGGIYVRATPGDFGLDYIYQHGIAPLQREQLDTEMVREYEDRFGWFLGVALLWWIAEAWFSGVPGRLRGRWGRRSRASGPGVALALGVLAYAAPVEAIDAQSQMEQGRRAYTEARFEDAAQAFRAAAEAAPGGRRDAARARYNEANALYQQGRFEDAARVYQEALRSTDLHLQQAAAFNRGNALLAEAAQLSQAQELDAALQFAEKAIEQYRNVLTLQPDDRAAKINHELAEQFREELEERIAQQPPTPESAPDEQPESDEGDDEADSPPDPSGEEADNGDEDPVPEDRSPVPDPSEMDGVEPDNIEEMTEEEAHLLLDALRDEEQETRDQMRLQLGEPAETEKDW